MICLKIGKFEIDNGTLLRFGSAIVGITGMVISNLVAAHDQKKLKLEIEEDVFKKISKGGD